MYYALTINNLELTNQFKSIDSVYKFLNPLCKEINYISVERNELNDNIHYHILCEDYCESEFIDFFIWNKSIEDFEEVKKYINYLKKDGKFKVYVVPAFTTTDCKWYERAFSLVKTKESLLEVFESDLSLLKYYNQISRLWELYHKNPYHKYLINHL